MKIKKTILFVVIAWTVLISISLIWNLLNAKGEQERLALKSARSFFDHIVITRIWNSRHGGLYAPITDKTKPNQHLNMPMRDIRVNEMLTLTMVNPAFMTRQISEIAMEKEGVQFHITSLKPIRPKNKPTALETESLKAFEKGTREKGLFIKKGEKTSFFYMAPLLTEKSCLTCHAEQGYKENDVRGGISVTSPFIMKIPFRSLLAGHLIIGIAGLIGIILTGSCLHKAYETIRKQSVFDALTGVPNRRSFTESILKEYKRCMRNKHPLSVIMCDVDKFKEYNDAYGHSKGDDCLKKVANAVQHSLKRPGDFCARYGGKEFIVLLPNTPLEGAATIAERIRRSVESIGILHDKSHHNGVVTISLGVASSEGAALANYEELVKHADIALYRAKQHGRNRVDSFISSLIPKQG